MEIWMLNTCAATFDRMSRESICNNSFCTLEHVFHHCWNWALRNTFSNFWTWNMEHMSHHYSTCTPQLAYEAQILPLLSRLSSRHYTDTELDFYSISEYYWAQMNSMHSSELLSPPSAACATKLCSCTLNHVSCSHWISDYGTFIATNELAFWSTLTTTTKCMLMYMHLAPKYPVQQECCCYWIFNLEPVFCN